MEDCGMVVRGWLIDILSQGCCSTCLGGLIVMRDEIGGLIDSLWQGGCSTLFGGLIFMSLWLLELGGLIA